MQTLEGLAIVFTLTVVSIMAVFFVTWVVADHPTRWEIEQALKEAVYFILVALALMLGWFAFNIWTGGSAIWPSVIVLCILVALYIA
jgi:cell division protein FtsW (lipid II flippase)